jgi:phosphatidylglycerophosphate synthase
MANASAASARPVDAVLPSSDATSTALTEAWIVRTGEGPALLAPVAGMSHLLRLVCALRAAGIERVVVVPSERDPAALERLRGDRRVAGMTLEMRADPPVGPGRDPILLVRADRIFHRDGPRRLAHALVEGADVSGQTLLVDDPPWDALALTSRARAEGWARDPEQALAGWGRAGETRSVAAPYLGFSVPAAGEGALERAEALLVASLRKPVDGLAARVLNRHVSLWATRRLMGTGVRPDHVTCLTIALGLAAGLVCALGGYWAALVSVLLLELGSILDGVDGELARLKYWQSRRGEWLDTVSDDLANVSFIAGATANLAAGGASWAWPAGAAALSAFVLTQASQYVKLVKRGSGDLLSLSWFGEAQKGLVATLVLLVRRDFFVTLFVALVAIGRLDVVLGLSVAGSLGVAVGVIAERLR